MPELANPVIPAKDDMWAALDGLPTVPPPQEMGASAPEPPPAPSTPEPKQNAPTGRTGGKESKQETKPAKDEKPTEPAPSKETSLELDEFGLPKKSEVKKEVQEEEIDPEHASPPELRTSYQKLKARTTDLERQLAEAGNTDERVQKIVEERLADRLKTVPPPEEIQALSKKAQEYEERLEKVAYLESPRYKAEYITPIEEALKVAAEEVAELKVQDIKSGATRKGNIQDIFTLAQLPLGERQEAAKAMFGEMAEYANGHARKLRDLWQKREKAEGEWQNNSVKFKEEAQTAQAQALEKAVTEFSNYRAATQKTVPEWFEHDKTDEVEVRLLAQMEKLVEVAFDIKPNGDWKKALQSKATVAEYGKYFPIVQRRMAAQTKRIEELEAKLAEYEQSEAPPTTKTTGGAPARKKDIWDGIDDLPAVKR